MKNLDFKKIYEWPRSSQGAIFIIVFLVAFYFGFQFDIAPIKASLIQSQAQENDLKQQYAMIISKEAVVANDLSQYPALLEILNKWKSKLVSYATLPELLNEILKIGANNHLYFSLFSPAAEVKTENYVKVPIKVVMVGTYHQIASFLSQVVNMQWMVMVGDLTISSQVKGDVPGSKTPEVANADNLLTAELMLDVYYTAGKQP